MNLEENLCVPLEYGFVKILFSGNVKLVKKDKIMQAILTFYCCSDTRTQQRGISSCIVNVLS